MKKILFFASFMSFSLITISCQFSESIYINEDGSGKVSFVFNGDEFMKMGGDMPGEQKEIAEKSMDTIIDFKQFLEEKKDSIAQLPPEDQEKLRRLENFKMHILVDESIKKMTFDMYSQFEKVSELADVFNTFKTASVTGNSLKSPGTPIPGGDPMSKTSNDEDYTKVHYSFEKNVFKRYTEILDEEKRKQSVDSLSDMKMFLSGSNYKLQYHFPRKIRKVNNEKALFSQDGKSFVMEVGFMELMENPTVLDITVELEE